MALALVLLAGCSRPVPEPTLEQLEPVRIAAVASSTVTVRGKNLLPKVQVDFDAPDRSDVEGGFELSLVQGRARVALADVAPQSTEAISGRVPLVATARYDVELKDPYGRVARLEAALEVVQCLDQTHCFEDSACHASGVCQLTDGGTDPRLPDGGLPPVAVEVQDGGPTDGGPFCTDADGDGVYAAGCAVQGPVDCDDQDPFTYPGAPELCDRRDNDCNGRLDPGSCPSSNPAWTQQANTGGNNHDWAAASAWSTASVWIAGRPDRLSVRVGDGGFEDRSAGCDGYFRAAWVDPQTGTVYLGGARNPSGNQSRLTRRALDGVSCVNLGPSEGGSQVTGLVGFGAGAALDVYGVKENGDTFVWNPAADTFTVLASTGIELNGIHGTDPGTMFAVGVNTSANPDVPRILRYLPATQSWKDEGVQLLPGVSGKALHAIHVTSATLAHAVGDEGLVVRWDGNAWTVLPAPANVPLRAVLAFGGSQLHVADRAGSIRRFDGSASWEVLFSDNAATFTGLAGTGPDDLWAVGLNGWVLRWP